MKRLLENPVKISAPTNTPDEEEVFLGVSSIEDKYREKLPWVIAISQQLQQNQKEKKVSIETKEHEVDSFSAEPRIPEKPKPSTARSAAMKLLSPEVKKSVNFQPYKSTRPDLLQKLTNMLEKGLLELQKLSENSNADGISPTLNHLLELQRKFQLYAGIFEKYINESTLYQKILEEIHDGYHEYIAALQEQWEVNGDARKVLQAKDQEMQTKLQEIQQIHQLKYQVLQETNRLLEKKIEHLERDKSKAETDSLKHRESYHQLKREFDEIRNTAVTLTAALARMEEEHRTYQTNEANRVTELSHAKASEQKLNEEIDRLQHQLQMMEQIQAHMVPQEAVTNLEMTIDSLRSEVKRMETTHRQLLLRYASIKAVVDDCFKRWENDSMTSSTEVSQLVTREAVDEVIQTAAMVKRKKDLKKKVKTVTDPVEQIMLIMEKQGNPRIIIETMLDHIMQNAAQKNRFGGYDNDSLFGSSPIGRNNPLTGMGMTGGNEGDQRGVITTGGGTIGFEHDGTSLQAEEFKSPWTHFDGLGYNLHIASYLRFHGKIQNLFFSKREMMKLLQEIWEAKRAYDQYIANQQIIIANSSMNLQREDMNLLEVFGGEQPPPSAGRPSSSAAAGGGFAEHNLPNDSVAVRDLGGGAGEVTKPSTAQSVTFSNPDEDLDGERKKVSSRQHIRRKLSRSATYQTTQSLIESTQQQNQDLINSGVISLTLIDYLATISLNPPMAIFLEAFLQDKVKDRLLAIELAYNLHDALKRFAAVSDCRLFSAVLEEKLPMEIYEDQRNMIERVQDEVNKEIKMLRSSTQHASQPPSDLITAGQFVQGNHRASLLAASMAANDPNSQQSHKISIEDLMRLLKRLFPTKSEQAFVKLNKALTIDNQNSRFVLPKDILYEDLNGNRPHFLEQLKLQHITEAIAFEKHLMDCIDQFNEQHEREMMLGKYREAILYADPHKSRTEVNKLLARGSALSIEEMLLAEAKRQLVNIEDFKLRLKAGLLQRSSPITGGGMKK